MNRILMLSLALVSAPLAAGAQTASEAQPPPMGERPALTAQQQAAMQQVRTLVEQNRAQTRARLLAALTPAHRTAVASIVGQLVLSTTPNPKAAIQSLDAILAPAEKTSILNISAADKANMRTIMQQQRSIMESSMTADQKAAMAQREAQRQTFMQAHPRPAHVPDAGAILLRTLGDVGGPGGPGGRWGMGMRG